MLDPLLKGLVVVGRGTGDAGARRALVEHRRHLLRVVDLLGDGSRCQKVAHAEIAMVVGVLDTAERVAGHGECDERLPEFRLSTMVGWPTAIRPCASATRRAPRAPSILAAPAPPSSTFSSPGSRAGSSCFASRTLTAT